MENFKKLGLSAQTIEALAKKGYEEPTPIQEKTIPVLMEGKLDVIGKAQTGTGKTACFALPIIETINLSNSFVQALILCPTRELAMQVSEEIESLKGSRKIKIMTVYGGTSIMNQINTLKRGVQIVVGTPGRVIDLINRRKLNISNISFAVLDEADEMLNMGFLDDIKTILTQAKHDKRMLMFSATMPKEISIIAKRFMREHIVLEVERQEDTHKLTEQVYYNIKSANRFEGIKRILAVTPDFYGIIFCKTKSDVDQLAQKLKSENFSADAIHGDFSQAQRETVFKNFKSKTTTILIATDVAARGLDVNDLTHVVNYSLPQSPETYVHRIGRTGRAGKKGIAITFVIPSERRQLKFVERIINHKLTRKELPKVEDVIEFNKLNINDSIQKIIESGKYKKYYDLAETMITEFKEKSGQEVKPEVVLAAVLKNAYHKFLEPHNFRDIGVIDEDDDRSGSRGRSRGGSRGRSGKRSSGRSGDRSGGRRNDSRGRSDRNRSDRNRSDRSGGSNREMSPSRGQGGKSRDKKPRKRSRDSDREDRRSKKKKSSRRDDRPKPDRKKRKR